ncbi:MAG: hypothetical protein AAF125_25550, partial [Chloroflexota bacterium]
DGTITLREPTLTEQIEAFNANLPILGDNIRDALFMFNYKGDVAWINNFPNAPHMDMLVGSLFILGLVAWGARIIRTRDPVDILMPTMLFLMLMPSALSIAYPVENPSATRTSGALPIAYLIAAYPMALILNSIWHITDLKRVAAGIGTVALGLVMAISLAQNANTYFNKYHANYLLSSLPYDQAGRQMRAFNIEVGSEGNTFMIAFPFWWDHRALGLEAGMVDYPNGIVSLEDVPSFLYDSLLRGGRYELDPTEDILFFLAQDDIDSLEQLREWFPNGEVNFSTVESQRRSWATYRVPAMGTSGFGAFVQQYGGLDTDAE